KSVNEFSLNSGPADVPAFYDFNTLQIAFEHVWKQLFDEEIIQAIQEVNEGVASVTGINSDDFLVGNFSNIETAVVEPAREALSELPRTPWEIASQFDITDEEF